MKRTQCVQNITYVLWPRDNTSSPMRKMKITKCVCPLEGGDTNWRAQQLVHCCWCLASACRVQGSVWNIWARKYVETPSFIKVSSSTEKKQKCIFSGPPPIYWWKSFRRGVTRFLHYQIGQENVKLNHRHCFLPGKLDVREILNNCDESGRPFSPEPNNFHNWKSAIGCGRNKGRTCHSTGGLDSDRTNTIPVRFPMTRLWYEVYVLDHIWVGFLSSLGCNPCHPFAVVEI